ncbi:hypothetical protein CVT26_006271 [Gymnopilus dilepis]|uniref:Uncharacterized protein n=1 Tax=Gymnopilus dilepis TaxID=231916 RepID=A0A409Y190_9AGAR|nr:hypothetical protein CVT26_006271 [Gymnopilus dilepis]
MPDSLDLVSFYAPCLLVAIMMLGPRILVFLQMIYSSHRFYNPVEPWLSTPTRYAAILEATRKICKGHFALRFGTTPQSRLKVSAKQLIPLMGHGFVGTNGTLNASKQLSAVRRRRAAEQADRRSAAKTRILQQAPNGAKKISKRRSKHDVEGIDLTSN